MCIGCYLSFSLVLYVISEYVPVEQIKEKLGIIQEKYNLNISIPTIMTQKQKRLALLLLLSLAVAVFAYSYLFEILFISTFTLFAWLAYDFINDFTKSTVNPAGKFVFITGCDSGFGLASAKAFKELGFHVIAGCFNDTSSGAKELLQAEVKVISLDVTSTDSVDCCLKVVKETCGGSGLWAVVNNSGINSMGYVEVCSMQEYQHAADVNLWGAIRVTKAVLPLIRKAKGRVVNVTSERGFNPWPQSSSYCITKFGLEAFSAVLRREMVQFGVLVSTVAPGNFSGSSAIINDAANASLRKKLEQGREALSTQDRESYTQAQIDELMEQLATDPLRSCSDPQPVVDAYVDAVVNLTPKTCYMVQGMNRKSMDPVIICARLRQWLPDRVMPTVTRGVMAVFNR